jgi:glycosyltransferase involved in cell wall biosynthesis
LPSREETFPFVVLEAMHAGLPVVATKVGAIPEIVVDGLNGFVCEPGDQNCLADRICKLVGNVDLRRRFGDNNRRTTTAFAWSAVAARTIEVYDRLLVKVAEP